MNASEEWLRYVENQTLRQMYGIIKYDKKDPEDEENSEEDKEKTKDSESV